MGDTTDLASATRVRIAETGSVFYRVREGAYTGLWEPSPSTRADEGGYVGDMQLTAKGTVIVEARDA